MYIIVGLGNPGKQYENTRHNVGFMAIDALAKTCGISVTKLKFRALIGEGRIGNERLVLVKPQTYMNLSGESVREIVNFYKEEQDKLLLIYDDMDTDFGSIRIRKKGSAGTHNGMRSVVSLLGSSEFPRVRIGIGSKGNKDAVDFVIGNFSKEEKKKLEEIISGTVKAVECFVENGIDLAMNRYNKKADNGEKAVNDK